MMFGEIIKKLRKEKKWTQDYVASKLNISTGALCRYELNLFEPRSIELIKKFADLFEVSTDYLLGKSDIRNPYEVKIEDMDIAFASGIKGLNKENQQVLKHIIEGLILKQISDSNKDKNKE